MSQSDKESKTKKLRAAIKQRVDKEERAFRLVEKMVLLDSVDKEFLLNAGVHITLSQYKDVTEERAITKLCGYPLCSNRIIEVLRQKYKISLRDKKVYDITERKNFCSNKCYKASKYFQSQLSTEPVWMKERTKSTELKLLDDGEELAKKFSGSGEEVLIRSGGRSDEKHELVHNEYEHVDNEHEHVDYEYEHGHDEHEQDHDEHEHVHDDHQHDHDKHELDDDEYVYVHDKYKHVDDEHKLDDLHKHMDGNEDLSDMIGRIENVLVDLDLADSDDDIGDDNEDTIDNSQETNTQNSENDISNSFKNDEMKTKAPNIQGKTVKDTNNDHFIPATRSKTHTTNLPKVDSSNNSSHKRNYHPLTSSGLPCRDYSKASSGEKRKTTDSPKKELRTNDFKKTLKPCDNELRSRGVNINTDGCSMRSSDNSQSSEKELAKKQCVDKVHEVLLDWCSLQTKEYISELRKEKELWDERGKVEVTKEQRGNRIMDTTGVILPSIDSKSQMVIRGKIVSEKLTMAISPMLSKLSISMADISSQLTCLLKTFRYTNTNIVLTPTEWKLAALILLLVVVKCSPSLTGLLSSRQKDLHRLLSNTVDDEEDIDRLLGVFNFEDLSQSESAMIVGQRQFDMEELD